MITAPHPETTPTFAVPYLNLVGIGLLLLAAAVLQIFKPRDKRPLALFFTAFLTGIEMLAIDWVLGRLCSITRIRYDLYVYCVDRWLGAPSFPLGRFAQAHPTWWSPVLYSYDLLPCAFLILAVAYFFLLPMQEAVRMAMTFFAACFLAPLAYLILPVAGPKYAFAEFPATPPEHLVPHIVYTPAPPNGIPSMHFCAALLLLHFARRWKLGTWLGSLYLLLTICSTLGTGEHYVVDLLAAIPYAIVILFVMGERIGRSQASASGVVKESMDTSSVDVSA